MGWAVVVMLALVVMLVVMWAVALGGCRTQCGGAGMESVMAGVMLTVVAVEASAAGVVCVLERASDGARASVTLSAQAAGGLSVGVGTVVVVTAFSAGWVLSAAGRAIAYIPNEIGAALLYNERVTR